MSKAILIALILSVFVVSGVVAQDTLYVWFGGEFQGTVWHDTVFADTGEWIDIPVYFRASSSGISIGDFCLPLGINKNYIVQFDEDSCQVYGNLALWDLVDFTNLNDEFQPNWASLTFLGWFDLASSPNDPYDPPVDSALMSLSFSLQAASGGGLPGQVICDALGAGLDPVQGQARSGDNVGSAVDYAISQNFACIKFAPGSGGTCDYTVGDVNNSSSYNGLDITYGIAYFKGGDHPLYQCECTPGNTWYVSGDVNGDCVYNGLDIGYGVNYLKGGSALIPCPDCPPTG